MFLNRTVLTTLPKPPPEFIELLPESQPLGQYVFGQSTFRTNPYIKRTHALQESHIPGLGQWLEGCVLGFLSSWMIKILTDLVLTYLSRRRSEIDDEPSECADAAVGVSEFIQLNWTGPFLLNWLRRLSSSWRSIFAIMVLAIFSIFFLTHVFVIILIHPRTSLSKPGEYNLKGTHPIAAGTGNAKFLRRVAKERPCVTPIFSKSNPSRNFSLSACITFDLERAHTHVNDTVHTVRIGSWFHKAGADHIITFGNATIKIRTRLFLYGAAGGTWRILFSMLCHDHLPAIRYLHELVMYGIMEESCNAAHATRNCDQILKEHRSESKPSSRTVFLWNGDNGTLEEAVLGLETRLFLKINKPWITVYKRVSPLLSAEKITEVEGPGFYSHTETGEIRENIQGLLVQEYRFAGVLGMLLADLFLFLILRLVRRLDPPELLIHKAWDLFECVYTFDEHEMVADGAVK